MSQQTDNNEEVALYKTFQWIVLIFSIVFFFILANGYFNLFVSKNKALAIVLGLFLASLAWCLAKFIGSSKEKIKGNLPFFILLLVLSSVGVFNSLMVNLEGKQIFQEAIDNAAIRFKDLAIAANKALKDPVLEAKRDRVENLKQMFFEELRNPQNCGQGYAASALAKKIKDELPAFQVLSGSGKCSNIDKIIASYDTSIEKLLLNSKEFTNANYQEIQATKNEIFQKEIYAQDKLIKIKNEISDGASLLTDVRLQLEDVATTYQILALQLSKYVQIDFPRTLEMTFVRDLGEWSQVINLLISRLDKLSSYVYLFLAIFSDWILIYFFIRLSNLKRDLPNKKVVQQKTGISSPWDS